MPCSRRPPVLLLFWARPLEPTLFPQGLEPPRGGVPREFQLYVEVPSEEHGPGASRAFGRRVHGHISPEGRLRGPGVAAAALAVDVYDREGAGRGHHIKGHGLAWHDVHDVWNFLCANTSARRAIKSPPRTAAADAAWASTPGDA